MEISILQWNVWFQESADNILAFLKGVDADIVCLQELTQNSGPNPNRDMPQEIGLLGYDQFYVATVDKPELPIGRMGNGIFSKHPIRSSRKVWVRDEPPEGSETLNESRAYLECGIEAGGKLLTVGTAHLSFTPGFSNNPEKDAESDVFIKAISQNSSNFIFTGDFNALPGSPLIGALDKSFKHAGPAYKESTWTTKPFDWGGFKADKLAWRLDYAYTTPDIEVISSQILKTDASDHLPILAKIKF
jgi:endonuclease/exonuclease/phosphatase family metal-dependent hydrolase